MNQTAFKRLLRDKGELLYRDMPWRADTRPYYVLVSEVMLQQTQVARATSKFIEFINRFPNEQSLAAAPLAEVIRHWQGLGYYRRAKYLHETAKQITSIGHFPSDQVDLMKLPGVGKNTAGAIAAYSFNLPSIFIETNIRTVYIHHFFRDNFDVSDKQILVLLQQTLNKEQPREFYWALMDYGSWLKASGIKNVSQSQHYKKQTALKGSVREVRGYIIRELSNNDMVTLKWLQSIYSEDPRLVTALDGLVKDGLISYKCGNFCLTK